MAVNVGITISWFSSNGDSRLLKAMQINNSFCDSQLYVQDTDHITTKLLIRILKPRIILPISDNFVSINHLKTTEIFSKD